MPKKLGNVSRSVLVNAALPQKTKTYTVISHSYAINTILKSLNDKGFTVEEEIYRCTAEARTAYGIFYITYQGDPELGMIYSFANSYDKSLRFRAAIGARVKLNDSYMISETDHWKRKHTGSADQETEELITSHIEDAQKYFDELKAAKDAMKAIDITKQEFGQIIGELFIEDFLAVDQMSMIEKEFRNPSFQYVDGELNLWTCYNHIIYALKQSHPKRWMQNQVGVHFYFSTKFNLLNFDEETVEETTDQAQTEMKEIKEEVPEMPLLPGMEHLVEQQEEVKEKSQEEVKDPNQIDLEQTIAEAEGEKKAAEPIKAHVESDEQYQKRVAEIEGEQEPEVKTEEELNHELHGVDNNSEVVIGSSKSACEGKGIESVEEVTENKDLEEKAENLPPEDLHLPEQEETPQGIAEKVIEEKLAKEPAPEPVTEEAEESEGHLEEPEEVYFPADEYEGLGIDDVFENEDVYYRVLRKEVVDGLDHLVAKVVDLEDAAPAVVEESNGEVANEPGHEKLPDIAPPTSPEILPPPPEQPAPPQTPNPGQQELPPDPLPEAQPTTEVNDDTEPVVKIEPIRKVIHDELEEIYGEIGNFDYKKQGNQYNITMESGESITLSAPYLEAKL